MGRPLVGHTYVVKNTYVELTHRKEDPLRWSQAPSTSEITTQDEPDSSCPSPPVPLEQSDLAPAGNFLAGCEPMGTNLAVLATPSPFLYPATPLDLPQDYDSSCNMLPPAFEGDGMIPFDMMGFDAMGMPFPTAPMMYDASTDMYMPCGWGPMDFEAAAAAGVDPSFMPALQDGVEEVGEVVGPEAAAAPESLTVVDEGAGYEGAGYEGAGYQGAGFEGTGYEGAGYEGAGYEGAGYEDAGFDGVGYEGAGYDGVACESLASPPPVADDNSWGACDPSAVGAGDEAGAWSVGESDPIQYGGASQVQAHDGDSGAPDSIWSSAGTTVMLRNIPNKYTRDMLVAQLNEDLMGKFDFVYLPIDFKNRCNVGYCFINFRTIEVRKQFVEAFDGVEVRKCLPGLNSKKVAEVAPARVHGLEDNVKRLKNSPVMNELVGHPEWMPLIFDEDGNELPFPLPDQPVPAMKPRSRRRGETEGEVFASAPPKSGHGRKDSDRGRPWRGSSYSGHW